MRCICKVGCYSKRLKCYCNGSIFNSVHMFSLIVFHFVVLNQMCLYTYINLFFTSRKQNRFLTNMINLFSYPFNMKILQVDTIYKYCPP